LARRPVPVIPMALRGLWRSMWSRRDSKLGRARLPRRFRAHVQLSTGAPMAPSSNAQAMEAAVRGLRGSEA
ncbi:MAG TPA: glycerol acyltransferase, partial [Rhodanobacteraceae bacterium]|nr:glycerol acyltransferase [Rhodanobacteraceae bacterium]